MNLTVKLEGLVELLGGLERVKSGMADTLNKGMQEAAFIVEGDAKKQITSGPNRAIDTGYLRSSIGVQSVTPFRATVQAGANYGVYIHEGTRYMRARPFLAAGLQDAVPEIERIFGKRIQTLIEVI